ncbi:MAG: GtrA family protein [Clostridia bacterium]|nr:GtrA family protein [Clostridia bacterium]
MIIDKIEDFFLGILDKIKLGFLADIYRNHREGMRYLVFGALTTVVNICVYIIFAKLIFSGFDDNIRVNISNILAIVISILFAYVTNKLWVFETKTNSKLDLLREFISFIGCRIVTAILDMVLMQITVNVFNWNDVLMKVLVNIIVIALNFVFSKLIIFKKKEVHD